MEFGRGLDTIIGWFYICGLSCYPSFCGFLTRESKRKHLLHYIPSIGLIALITSMGCFVYLNVEVDGPHADSIIYLYVMAPMFTVLICTIQMIFLSRYFGKIWLQINIFEQLSREQFSIDPRELRRQFMRRVYIILLSFLFATVAGIIRNCNNMFVAVNLLIMRAVVFLVIVHALFYIDLLDYLLQCFTRHVNVRAEATELPINVRTVDFCNRFSAHELKTEILQYKLLHFHLWKLSCYTNRLFGWTNVTTILYYFACLIFYVYSIFVRMHSPLDANILRKSICTG